MHYENSADTSVDTSLSAKITPQHAHTPVETIKQKAKHMQMH
jgi:hypothetical protein